jgi:hypothetical protein
VRRLCQHFLAHLVAGGHFGWVATNARPRR